MGLWTKGVSRSITGEVRIDEIHNLTTYEKVKDFVNKLLNKYRAERQVYCDYIMFTKHHRMFITWRIKSYKFTHEIDKSDNLLSELIFIQTHTGLIQNDVDMEELSSRVSYNRAIYNSTRSELSLLDHR